MRYLTVIQPGSQNTHCTRHGQQRCHCYISHMLHNDVIMQVGHCVRTRYKYSWGCCISGLFYSGNGWYCCDRPFYIWGCCNRWVVILPILWYVHAHTQLCCVCLVCTLNITHVINVPSSRPPKLGELRKTLGTRLETRLYHLFFISPCPLTLFACIFAL